jgi:hypothetical protein
MNSDLGKLLGVEEALEPFEARIIPAIGMIEAGGGLVYGSIAALSLAPLVSAPAAVPVLASGLALAGEGIYYGATGRFYIPTSCR